MLYTGCFSYTSRLKWCLQEHLPQTSAQHAIYRMFLLHIQAEMVPTGTSPTNQCPVCYIQRCFSYASRLKRCLWQTSPTKPCPDLYGMFLLHIQAQMVPTGTLPINQFPECYLQDVSLTLPGSNKHLPQTHAQHTLCRMFLLHIQAEMVPTGTPPTNQCPVCYIQNVCLTDPG